MAVDPQEAQEIRLFIRGLVGNLRMNYGRAMTDLGIDPDTVIRVQQQVAAQMVEWLETI